MNAPALAALLALAALPARADEVNAAPTGFSQQTADQKNKWGSLKAQADTPAIPAQQATGGSCPAVPKMGPKKGFDINDGDAGGDLGDILKLMGASWHYNWASRGKSAPGVEYVPLIRSDEIFQGASLSAGARAVLFLNEPDLAGQPGAISVEKALEAWPAAVASVPPNVLVGSPAMGLAWEVLNDPEHSWLAQFMAKRRGRVDFIAIHYYTQINPDDPSKDVYNLKRLLDFIHTKYCLPIWITEFGVFDGGKPTDPNPADEAENQRYHEKPHQHGGGTNKFTNAQAAVFMRNSMKLLESLDYVQRYAWNSPTFNNVPGSNATDVTWYRENGDPKGKPLATALGAVYGGR